MKRLDLKPGRAPRVELQQVSVGKSGPHPRVVDVPKGIDPGWAYAPGQSLMRTALEKTIAQSPAVASQWVRELLDRPRLLSGLHREFGEWLDGDGQALNNLFVVGAVDDDVLRALQRDHDIELDTVALSVTRERVGHGRRDKKRARDQALSDEDLGRLPEILDRPKAVLFDTEKSSLIYAFSSADGGGRLGKFTFHVNRIINRGVSNSYRTSGYVDASNLQSRRYVVLSGGLEE